MPAGYEGLPSVTSTFSWSGLEVRIASLIAMVAGRVSRELSR